MVSTKTKITRYVVTYTPGTVLKLYWTGSYERHCAFSENLMDAAKFGTRKQASDEFAKANPEDNDDIHIRKVVL